MHDIPFIQTLKALGHGLVGPCWVVRCGKPEGLSVPGFDDDPTAVSKLGEIDRVGRARNEVSRVEVVLGRLGARCGPVRIPCERKLRSMYEREHAPLVGLVSVAFKVDVLLQYDTAGERLPLRRMNSSIRPSSSSCTTGVSTSFGKDVPFIDFT